MTENENLFCGIFIGIAIASIGWAIVIFHDEGGSY
jgi:hypothetical protein